MEVLDLEEERERAFRGGDARVDVGWREGHFRAYSGGTISGSGLKHHEDSGRGNRQLDFTTSSAQPGQVVLNGLSFSSRIRQSNRFQMSPGIRLLSANTPVCRVGSFRHSGFFCRVGRFRHSGPFEDCAIPDVESAISVEGKTRGVEPIGGERTRTGGQNGRRTGSSGSGCRG